jgi:hypothetical protein
MLVALLSGAVAGAQPGAGAAAPSRPQAAPARDALGRDTPRGTLLGFMDAAREGRKEVAAQYLATKPGDPKAADLARKLFIVPDRRLPPRLAELSDRPGIAGEPAEARSGRRHRIAADDGGAVDLALVREARGAAALAAAFALDLERIRQSSTRSISSCWIGISPPSDQASPGRSPSRGLPDAAL